MPRIKSGPHAAPATPPSRSKVPTSSARPPPPEPRNAVTPGLAPPEDGFSSPRLRRIDPRRVETSDQLRLSARAAETRVMSKAQTYAEITDPAAALLLRDELQKDYAAWKDAVGALTRAGQLSAPEVKSFAAKTQQVALLHENLPEGARSLHGAAYRAEAIKELSTLFTAPASKSIDDNPLLLVPSLAREPSLEAAKARGIPTAQVTVNGKQAEVRSDVVMVFCPGVVRTGDEFPKQQEAALAMGLGAVRAETGTFHDAELNAEDIADAVKRAKELVGNPNAKVVLVGYSQGATNILSFMRDQQGAWGELREDVAGIHMMHPAAGGSQLADLAFALGGYLFEDKKPSERDLELIRSYYRAKADLLGLPPAAAKVNEEAIDALRVVFKAARKVNRGVQSFLGKLGIDVDDANLRQRLVGWMEKNEDVPKALADRGLLDRKTADKLEPMWDQLRKAYDRAVLTNPEVNGLVNAYLSGGMKSLTTGYATQLTSDPRLHQNLEGIPVLNSVGSVPEDRVDELVPKSQRLNVAFFKQLGLESDFQVSVDNQRLEPRLATAVDLPTEAVGHWGVAGLEIKKDHPASYFKDFDPPGLTHSAVTAFAALGIL